MHEGWRVNGDYSLAAGIPRVKVRGRVVVKIHPDDDSVEAGYLRHLQEGLGRLA